MEFKNYFSGHAEEYSKYRPVYPGELTEFLAAVSPRTDVAWEAGCGSGQLTGKLAQQFTHVYATDASEEQITLAPRLPNVTYRRSRAEESGIASGVVDLCVAAQAAHWFDLDAYYAEVRRVGRPGAAIALITYALMRVGDAVDAVIDEFYSSMQDAYWPPERRHVESGYGTLPFPFEELDAPHIEMRAEWSLHEFMGYIATWSGVRAMIKAEGNEPLDALWTRLAAAWGPPERSRTVRWPIALRAGRIG